MRSRWLRPRRMGSVLERLANSNHSSHSGSVIDRSLRLRIVHSPKVKSKSERPSVWSVRAGMRLQGSRYGGVVWLAGESMGRGHVTGGDHALGQLGLAVEDASSRPPAEQQAGAFEGGQ